MKILLKHIYVFIAGNVSSQLLYRALSRVAFMVRKCLITYEMDVLETL